MKRIIDGIVGIAALVIGAVIVILTVKMYLIP